MLDIDTIKKYWAYEEIISHGYKITFKDIKDGVRVSISDKYGIEASFKVKSYRYDLDTFSVDGYNVYDITNGNKDITEALDYTETIEDCVKGALYYFNTRY